MLHESYVQEQRSPWRYVPEVKKESKYTAHNYQLSLLDYIDDECDDCGFDVKNEKPVCVECFNDLEHDGFSNFHCMGCGEWFTENEVLRFQA
jgi:predicted amidophosphoribosyltransferase